MSVCVLSWTQEKFKCYHELQRSDGDGSNVHPDKLVGRAHRMLKSSLWEISNFLMRFVNSRWVLCSLRIWWMWHFHLPELRPRRSPKVVIMAPNRLRACEPCRVTESVTQHHQQCKHVAISDPHQYLSCIKNNQQHRLYDSVQMIAVKVIAVTKHPPFSRPVSRSVDLRLHKIGIASRGVAPPRQHVNHSAVMWPMCVTRNHH